MQTNCIHQYSQASNINVILNVRKQLAHSPLYVTADKVLNEFSIEVKHNKNFKCKCKPHTENLQIFASVLYCLFHKK